MITVKELIERLNNVVKNNGVDPAKEVIVDAWIAGPNDRSYPEGTVVFDCQNDNVRRAPGDPDAIHRLYICPTNISRIQ